MKFRISSVLFPRCSVAFILFFSIQRIYFSPVATYRNTVSFWDALNRLVW